jgi:hypothetical protein
LGTVSKEVLEAVARVTPANNSAYSRTLPDISTIAPKRRNASMGVKALHCERYIMDLVHVRRMGSFDMHVKEAEVVRIQKKQYSV